jgi:hypothetical protein
MSVPGVPGADLVVVEPGLVLGRSEAFFDGPACPGYADELSDSGVVRVVASVKCEFFVGDGPADQVLVVGVVGVDECPVVDTEPLRSDATGSALPRIGGSPRRLSWRGRSIDRETAR